MKLIIAEKPSVAQTIAAALGVKKRRDGYLEGDDMLISWCFGHLAGLADASIYDAKYGAWNMEDLPIIPVKWRHVVRSEKMKQFKILSGLMGRKDVTEVVNACDAGREGELIFRDVYDLAGCSKPIKRLWISSMEDEAIREGMAHLKDGAEYEGLYHAARCRAKADWLVGINATRFFSLVYHHTLKIGRVMSPTLALIVQREAEISAFTPESFFTVQLDLNPTVFSEKLKRLEEAEALAGLCKGKACIIRQITRKQRFEPAPKLYDLTTLQREANRVLGYTAQQTLDYAQSLYQQKLCTYPRTGSRYLTDDMEPRVPEYVAVAAKICAVDVPAQINAAQVCDTSQVSDHFALIPTLSCTEAALASVPAGERELLKLLALSVLRAVSGPYVTEETEVLADCEGRTFTTKGHTLVDTGWRKYVEGEAEDKPLPALTEGHRMAITGATVKEGKTSAPKRYTEAALLAEMESAGIGTPATRAE
ncbi:MAG: DNA topoisomerase III, partial [Clostridia bacterium]|nr:DNA topoisomerase III [Clostridia bacterium]